MKLIEEINPIEEVLPPFGLALCGGGAAGKWQAGVLVALAQIGVLMQAKVIAGTSIGGLNAGLFSLFGDPMGLEHDINIPAPLKAAIEIYERITKNSDIYKGELNLWGKIGAGLGFITGAESILDNTPLHKLLERIFGVVRLKDIAEIFEKHIIVSALNLNTQQEEFFSSFDGATRDILLSHVLKATSAIPGIFKSVSMDRGGNTDWYVDGGAGANNPFIALTKYNDAFPETQIKKAIIIFCYPDIKPGEHIPRSTKPFKSYRDALLGTLPAMMSAQEQIAEMFVMDQIKDGWDVLALYPDTIPCDSLDFTKQDILQKGYDYAVAGKGYSYKDGCDINIIDFLKR